MKEDKLPSYAELLDFYMKHKSEKRKLPDYREVSTEANLLEREYHNQVLGNQKIRLVSIDLAVKNIEFGYAFQFAEQIENYIKHGEIPEIFKSEKKIANSKE